MRQTLVAISAVAISALALMAALPVSKAIRTAAASPASGKQSAITAAAETSAWTSLFDGTSIKGWHSYGKKTAAASWEIKDGAIHLDKSKGEGGDLVSDKVYGNFDLKIEWKISPKGNSGILFYVQEDTVKYEEPYYTGPEMQVLDNDGHSDGKIHKHRAGDLYDLIPCTTETVKPVGEWNEAEIWCKDGQLKLFLNGTNVVSTTLWDDNWKTLVAGSKFKRWPDFGTFKKGHIDLQDHGNEVWYRNIRIKEL